MIFSKASPTTTENGGNFYLAFATKTLFMRSSLLFFILTVSSISVYAQKDTTLTYLDSKDKPCTAQKAVRYTVQFFENNKWKKEVFDNYDDKIEEIFYYKDAAGTVMDGPYRRYYKNQNIATSGQYIDNKKEGAW